MRQIIDTLAQLQRLRDKSVKDITIQLAKQKQVCSGYDSNIRALGCLIQKTGAEGNAPSVASLKNVTDYKGTLRKVIAWQEQEKALAKIKEDRIQKSLIAAACQEKVVTVALEERRHELSNEGMIKDQKRVDEIATQCWLRQKILGLE